MLEVAGKARTFRMEPGAWRSRPEHDNVVGRHIPPSVLVEDFMRHEAPVSTHTQAVTYDAS